MVKVTHEAATLLASSRESAGHPDSFGARFFVAEIDQAGKARIGFDFVSQPQPQDQIVERDGVSVYVAPDLAEGLGDATIDAQEAGAGTQLILKK